MDGVRDDMSDGGADVGAGAGADGDRPLRLVCIGGAGEAIGALGDRLVAALPPPGVEIVALPVPPASGPDAAPRPRVGPAAGLLARWARGRAVRGPTLAQARPDMVLWCGPVVPGPELAALVAARIPAVAVDTPAPQVGGTRAQRRLRQGLGRFGRVLARSEAAARALRRAGPPGLTVEVAGPLVPVPDPLPCSAAEREDVVAMLGARPVWLAACPTGAELPDILAAHRAARLTAHRLLLVLVPAAGGAGPGTRGEPEGGGRESGALAAHLRAQGWTVACRARDEEPGEVTEIYLADTADEMGLWYRAAPVTVLGGTVRGGPVPAPSGPASLGSAIVAGPRGGAALGRFVEAGAALVAPRPEALGAALSEALSPERAAALAHAGWDVVTAGARVEARLVAAVRDLARQVRR